MAGATDCVLSDVNNTNGQHVVISDCCGIIRSSIKSILFMNSVIEIDINTCQLSR